MLKLDLKAAMKPYIRPSAEKPEIVDIPPMQFLMLDGRGDPNTVPEYTAAVQALYSTAYTIRFALKNAGIAEYSVPALEGLWWVDELDAFSYIERRNWRWTMMIMQPDVVTREVFEAGRTEALRKKGEAAIELIRLESFDEGLAAQIMHIGPYSAEPPTIEHLHRFVEDSGYRLRDKHHEIYLSDPRRTDPAKMKTVLRHPVERIAESRA